MPKRHLSSDAEVIALRSQLIAQMASLSDRDEAEVAAAVEESPSATVLELGLNSAMGIALKGWVFHTLEAELTTFELLKQPLEAVVLSIEGARRHETGVALPEPKAPVTFEPQAA